MREAREATNKGEKYFKCGYNCAQSVLLPVMEAHDIDCYLVPRIATGFGGGRGGQGELCGALTGATMALSILFGTDNPEEDRKTCGCLIREFDKRFVEIFKYKTCKQLLGHDISTPEGFEAHKTVCPKLVRGAIDIVMDLKNEQLYEIDKRLTTL